MAGEAADTPWDPRHPTPVCSGPPAPCTVGTHVTGFIFALSHVCSSRHVSRHGSARCWATVRPFNSPLLGLSLRSAPPIRRSLSSCLHQCTAHVLRQTHYLLQPHGFVYFHVADGGPGAFSECRMATIGHLLVLSVSVATHTSESREHHSPRAPQDPSPHDPCFTAYGAPLMNRSMSGRPERAHGKIMEAGDVPASTRLLDFSFCF